MNTTADEYLCVGDCTLRREEREVERKITEAGDQDDRYQAIFGDVSRIIDAARESATRSVNAAMTATYWLIGLRIVEFEQSGEERAAYGSALIERPANDLTPLFGRGFSRQNLHNMRLFYINYPSDKILQTVSGKSNGSSIEVQLKELFTAFPLP